jgi:hypothetical protein
MRGMLLPEKQMRLHSTQRLGRLSLKLRAEGWNMESRLPLGRKRGAGLPSGFQWLKRYMQELRVHAGGMVRAPSVRAEFSGDMNAPDSLSATLHVDTDEFTFRDYALESLSATAVWRDGALDIQEFSIEDKSGHLNAVGRLVPNRSLEGEWNPPWTRLNSRQSRPRASSGYAAF